MIEDSINIDELKKELEKFVNIKDTEKKKEIYEKCVEKFRKCCVMSELEVSLETVKDLIKIVKSEYDIDSLEELAFEIEANIINLKIRSFYIKADIVRRYKERVIYSKLGDKIDCKELYRCVLIKDEDIELKELTGEIIKNEDIDKLFPTNFSKLVVVEKVCKNN